MPSRLRRYLKFGVLALLGVILLLVLMVGFLLWDPVSRHRIATRATTARQAGDPVTLQELSAWVPEPPPGENAARLLEEAASMAEATSGTDLYIDLPIVGASELPPPNKPFPAGMLARARQYVADRRAKLHILHQAAEVPRCKLEFDTTGAPMWGYVDGGSPAKLGLVRNLRDCVGLLALEAVERGASGQPDEAALSLCAALRVTNALRAHPEHTYALPGIAFGKMVVYALGDVMARGQPSAAASLRLEQALKREVDAGAMEGMLLRQRCLAFEVYPLSVARLADDGFSTVIGGGDEPDSCHQPGLPTRAYFALTSLAGMLPAERLCYINVMSECIELARRPYPQSVMGAPGLLAARERKTSERYVICRATLTALRICFLEVQRVAAQLDSVRTALAALRYAARHGKLPETLADLAPGFVVPLPPDPFDGKPLRYRKEADGFVVYSVGENGQDDVGNTERDKQAGARPDIGFRVRSSKAQ